VAAAEEVPHAAEAAGDDRDAAKNELMLLSAANARFASELTLDISFFPIFFCFAS
jgi:hypothetical protein